MISDRTGLQLKAIAKEFHDACCDGEWELRDKIALTVILDCARDEIIQIAQYYTEYRLGYGR